MGKTAETVIPIPDTTIDKDQYPFIETSKDSLGRKIIVDGVVVCECMGTLQAVMACMDLNDRGSSMDVNVKLEAKKCRADYRARCAKDGLIRAENLLYKADKLLPL